MANELELVIEGSPKLSPRSKTNYLRAVRSFTRFAGSDWNGIQVEHWRNQLLMEGLKPQTVNLYLAGLRYASRRRAERRQDPTLDFARYAETLKPDEPAARRALTFDEGDNTVTLRCESGLDIIYVDKFVTTYPRSLAASTDELIFTHEEGYRYQITGFTTTDLMAFDITSPGDVARVIDFETIDMGGPYTLD